MDSTLVSVEACDDGVRYLAPELATVGLTQKLETSEGDLQANDAYGQSVAVSGDVAIIGASYDDRDGRPDKGSAFVFERDPATGKWVRAQRLVETTTWTYVLFGEHVAVSGDVAAISAHGDDDDGNNAGAVYIYERGTDGIWGQQQKIKDPSPGAEDKFGLTVAIDSDVMITGTINKYSGKGAAYIYRNSETGWTLEEPLTASDGVNNDYFGRSVAIEGDIAVVGASYRNSATGAVYVFRKSGGTWAEDQILEADDGDDGDYFGTSVAIADGIVFIGAPDASGGGVVNSGAVYVFEYDSFADSLSQSQKLTASDGAASDRFGYCVSISGGAAIVGAYKSNSSAGAAYVFSREFATGKWTQTEKFAASDEAGGVQFGWAVAVSGDVAIIGANKGDGLRGSAFVLEIPRSPVAVSASDGEFDSRVRVTWDDISSNEHGFRIYRDDEPIASVATNVEVYEDFDAEPGRTYEYSVAAYRSELTVELERVSDYGWRPPNGNITGRISALGGGASDGIYVGLDPLPTKSLLMDGAGGHARVPDPDGNFNFTVDDNYAIEAWVKYLGDGGSGAGDGTLIAKSAPRGGGDERFPFWLSNKRSAGEPGRLQFSIGDGVKTVSVNSHSDTLNDNTWHHVACVHNAELDEISIYIDGNLEGITPYTGLGDITNADSLSLGAGAKSESWYGGQLDEVRIWNAVRDEDDIQSSMSQQMSGDESGLVAYWPLDEGSRGVITDPYADDHYGIFEGGIYWSDYGAPLDIYVQTGLSGNYVLSDLHYGNETTFKVIPFEGNRQFDPPFTMITLSIDHPVQNQVDFVDISSYTLSGVVMYGTTGCAAADIPVFVDNRMAGSTDKNGKFAVSVDNGSHSLKPELEGHAFTPDSLTFFVEDDIEGLSFKDLTSRTLSGDVGGGCNHQIGDVEITIRGENGCLTEVITADSEYSIALPPLTYLVSATVDVATIPDGLSKADVVRFFQDLGERQAVLDSSDTTLDMLYRAPLEVTIQGLESYIPDCEQPLTFDGQPLPANLPVLEQGIWYGVLIEVYENYGSQGLCPLDNGTVVIYDEIADREGTPVEIGVSNGVASYTTFACTPSLILGRVDSEGNDRSFQKVLTAIAVVEGRAPVTADEWVIVTGQVAEEGADFITAKTNEVFYILRDPPGDQSYSFVEEGFSLRHKDDYEKTVSSGQAGVKLYTSFGATGRFWFGFGAGTGTLFKFQNTTESEILFGGTTYYEKGIDKVFATKERFTTSPDERFIGEQNDIFVGAGFNYIFTVVQHVELEDCEVTRYPGVGFEPDAIETIYAYTQRYIEESLIPEIDAKVDFFTTREPDEFQAGRFTTMRDDWLAILARNDTLKTMAITVEDGNLSFSGGTEYSFVRDSVETRFHSLMRTFTFDAHTDALGIGWASPAGGFKVSLPVKTHVEYLNPGFWNEQGMLDVDTTYSKRVGFVLSDDNIGDRFTVDVKRDGVFPSLVFDVLAGASSCPYEAWPDLETGEPRMMSRDKPELSILPFEQSNVPPDEKAVFTLNLYNGSPTGEARRYVLREVATANPHGALIRVNGVFINDDLVYYPEGGTSLNLTVTIERGPEKYDYDNLAIMVYPLCEWWLFEVDHPLNLADTVSFDVTFEAPCTDITMLLPEPGWASTKDNPDIDIVLVDFELQIGEDNMLENIFTQYRRMGAGDEGPSAWQTICLLPPDSSYCPWTPPASLRDGVYELRAYTDCDKGFVYSDPVVGTIDRHAPVVFGTPEPSDGDLSFGEDIRVVFNEPIDCTSVDSLSVGLVWLDGPNAGQDVPFETACDGNSIVIAPTAADTDLEGRRLEASVSAIRDGVGNVMEDSVTWAFDYRKSRFAWTELYLVDDVPLQNPGTIAAELANGTGDPIDYTITALPTSPAWITGATPSAGTILPGQTQTVTLSLDQNLAEGVYEGRVEAETAGPDPSLAAFDLNVTVSCHDPVWMIYPNNYEHSMTMVANLMINSAHGELNDRLAAYVGNELRGVADVELVPVGIDNYAAFLTVYSNRASGETVRFQIWDDSDCKLYNATVESHPFVANNQIGSPGTPVTLTATEVLGNGVLAIAVDEGWNWFSTNIRSLDMGASAVLADLTPESGDIVKSQTAFSQFVDETTGWAPVLLLDNVSGYMARLSQPGLILHTGAVVPVDSAIPVSQGWNWIGYLPDGPIEVTEALDDLRVQAIAQDDDIVKSQDGFAQYVNSHQAWYGSLDSMRTGEGYKLYLAAGGDHSFNYPAYVPSPSPPLASAPAADSPEPVEGTPEWAVNYRAYQYNMTVTAVLRIDDAESSDPNDMVGAFVGDECRGVARPVFIDGVDRYLAFLMIHSNAAEGEEVTFRAFDAGAGLIYDVDESLTCEADAVEGTVTAPVALNAGSVWEEEQEMPTKFGLAQNFPNPFNPTTAIRYDVPAGGGNVTLKVYDVGGRLVRTLVDGFEAAGRKTVAWHGQNDRGEMVATGVYFYRMTAPGFERTRKMVLLK
jgi:hypothetical protein